MNKKGAALAIVIMIFLALVLSVGVVFVIANASISSADTGIKAREAYLASKSGVEAMKAVKAKILAEIEEEMEAEIEAAEESEDPSGELPIGIESYDRYGYVDGGGNIILLSKSTINPENDSNYKNARIQLNFLVTENRSIVTDPETGAGDYNNTVEVTGEAVGKSAKESMFTRILENGVKLPLPNTYAGGMQLGKSFEGWAGDLNPEKFAVYLKGNFSVENQGYVYGDIYTDIGAVNLYVPNVSGKVYHRDGYPITCSGNCSDLLENRVEVHNTPFYAPYPDMWPIDFDSLNHLEPVSIVKKGDTVDRNAHITELRGGGNQENARIIFDTSNGNLYVLVDTLTINNAARLQVLGDNKLFLFIKETTGTNSLIIENYGQGNPDNLVIVTKVPLRFREGNTYPLNFHMVYQCESACEDTLDYPTQIKHTGSFITNLKHIRLKPKGGFFFKGLFYAPEAHIDYAEFYPGQFHGRLVAKSLSMYGSGKIWYDSSHLYDFFGIWEVAKAGWPEGGGGPENPFIIPGTGTEVQYQTWATYKAANPWSTKPNTTFYHNGNYYISKDFYVDTPASPDDLDSAEGIIKINAGPVRNIDGWKDVPNVGENRKLKNFQIWAGPPNIVKGDVVSYFGNYYVLYAEDPNHQIGNPGEGYNTWSQIKEL